MLTASELDSLLARFADLRIAVVGDFFLDKYLVIDPSLAERSLETGLEARQIVAIRTSPGAAGTVTNNLAALGVGAIRAIGIIGDDGEGYDLLKGLRATGVRTDALLCRPDRFTPTYTKPMALSPDGEREMERLDIKNRSETPAACEDTVLAAVRQALEAPAGERIQAVILADQVEERNAGVITDRVRAEIGLMAAAHPDVAFFADSRRRIGEFRHVRIKPNAREAVHADGGAAEAPGRDEGLAAAKRLARRNGRTVFVTAGPDGIFVCTPDGHTHVPGVPVSGPIDIVGAGDSATAGIVCALCAGADEPTAALVGNLCASVTIRKLGTTGTASQEEVRGALRQTQTGP